MPGAYKGKKEGVGGSVWEFWEKEDLF